MSPRNASTMIGDEKTRASSGYTEWTVERDNRAALIVHWHGTTHATICESRANGRALCVMHGLDFALWLAAAERALGAR